MDSSTHTDLQARLSYRERQLAAVHRVSAALFQQIELEALLRQTLLVSLDTVGADAGSILLYDAERRRLVFRHVVGKTELIGREIDPTQDRTGKAATVFREGRSLITEDAPAQGHNVSFDADTGYRTRTILTVPLRNLGGDPVGVLQALNKHSGRFDDDDRELLEIVGDLAATSIVNARLAEEAQLAAVARAVGDLGHDIKNALTPVQTMVDTTVDAFATPMFGDIDALLGILRERDPLLAERLALSVEPLRAWIPEMRASVADGCADIQEMVGEIADYVKGAQATHLATYCLREVLEERLRRLAVLARNRGVSLQLVGTERVPEFAFDRRLIGRAVYNLVNNALGAIDAAVKDGRLLLRPFQVVVRVEFVEQGDYPDGGFCLIVVQDDGPGIEPRVRDSLFTSRTISTTAGGTGIGTRFVKGVATAHGGEVWVRSEPGAGAAFTLKLPLRRG